MKRIHVFGFGVSFPKHGEITFLRRNPRQEALRTAWVCDRTRCTSTSAEKTEVHRPSGDTRYDIKRFYSGQCGITTTKCVRFLHPVATSWKKKKTLPAVGACVRSASWKINTNSNRGWAFITDSRRNALEKKKR